MIDKDINISVVIVNYNSIDYLEQCIASIKVANSTFKYEIIIVDNHSSDSPSFEFINRYENVRLIRLDENLGFAKANNIGVAQTNGKYILILNPDTLLDENTLEVMYEYMENHTEVGLAGCKVLNSDGTFQLACRRGFPTPWVSFTRLFGLQKLFPKSRTFARYNQTFRPINETYYLDSVIGAFMFVRRSVWDEVSGFDETYFMYGEDIDLCYRISKYGWKIAYVSTTSIIHFKGVSTRRSSIDDLQHFYSAMSIFSRKHYSNSGLFLLFLKSGIYIRKQIAKLLQNGTGFLIFLLDVLSVNFSLALATKIRFGGFFNFPDYAYPDVFIVLTLILITSMIAVGEYLEGKHTVSKSIQSLLITFFILSSMTYFFKDFAFSRGVVLMTVGFSIILTSFIRITIELYEKIKGRKASVRIAIAGTSLKAIDLFNSIKSISSINTEIHGFILVNRTDKPDNLPAPVIGSIDYIDKIVDEKDINEIVVSDDNLTSNDMIPIMESLSQKNVRFHFVNEINDYIVSGIINDIEGKHLDKKQLNLSKVKFRILKRFFDILFSFIFLTFGLPFVILLFNYPKVKIKNLWNIFKGKMTFIGLYGTDKSRLCLPGALSLAKISNPDLLSEDTIRKLNNYYLKNYSLTLDIEIIFKYIIRKNRGN